jgi:hypothetical protein
LHTARHRLLPPAVKSWGLRRRPHRPPGSSHSLPGQDFGKIDFKIGPILLSFKHVSCFDSPLTHTDAAATHPPAARRVHQGWQVRQTSCSPPRKTRCEAAVLCFPLSARGIQSLNASQIFLVDPAAVVTTTQNRAPQEAICDRSSWDEHGPDVPNFLIWRSRLRADHPKNVMLACSHARHCGPTVRAGTPRTLFQFDFKLTVSKKP